MGTSQSSTYVYCPPGYKYTTLNQNGTLFLICAPRQPQEQATQLDAGAVAGIVVACIGFALIVVLCCCCNRETAEFILTCGRRRVVQPEHYQFQTPREIATRELTPRALEEFRAGILSDYLKEELMILRIRKAQDLITYIEYADACGYPEIARWLSSLNPGNIPQEIRQKANRPRTEEP